MASYVAKEKPFLSIKNGAMNSLQRKNNLGI